MSILQELSFPMAMLCSQSIVVPFTDGDYSGKTAFICKDVGSTDKVARPLSNRLPDGNLPSVWSTDNAYTLSSIPPCLQIQRPATKGLANRSSQKASDDTQCLLIDLPKHIRGRIYRFTLFPNPTRPNPDFPLSRNRGGYHLNDTSTPYQPPTLLSINQQIREEASEIFYSEARFWMTVSYHLPGEAMRSFQRWRASLRPADRRKTTRMRIEFFRGAIRLADARVWVKRVGWSLEDGIGSKVELRVQLGAHRIVFGSVARTMDDICGV